MIKILKIFFIFSMGWHYAHAAAFLNVHELAECYNTGRRFVIQNVDGTVLTVEEGNKAKLYIKSLGRQETNQRQEWTLRKYHSETGYCIFENVGIRRSYLDNDDSVGTRYVRVDQKKWDLEFDKKAHRAEWAKQTWKIVRDGEENTFQILSTRHGDSALEHPTDEDLPTQDGTLFRYLEKYGEYAKAHHERINESNRQRWRFMGLGLDPCVEKDGSFLGRIRFLEGWEGDISWTYETDSRLPITPTGNLATNDFANWTVEDVFIDEEKANVEKNTFSVSLSGDPIKLTYEKSRQAEYGVNHIPIRLQNGETIELPRSEIRFDISGLDFTNLSQLLRSIPGKSALVKGIYEGDVEGKHIVISVNWGRAFLKLDQIVYGVDQVRHRNGVFLNFYVHLLGIEMDEKKIHIRPGTNNSFYEFDHGEKVFLQQSKNRAGFVHFAQNKAHHITDVIKFYQIGGNYPLNEWGKIQNSIYKSTETHKVNPINEILYLEGLEEGDPKDYRRGQAPQWAASSYIYSDHKGELFSTVHRQERWTALEKEEERTVSLFYKGTNLYYVPGLPGLEVHGALLNRTWPQGLYRRTYHAQGTIREDLWENIETRSTVRLIFGNDVNAFYETLSFPPTSLGDPSFNSSPQAYSNFVFFSNVVVKPGSNWSLLNGILASVNYRSFQFKDSGMSWEGFNTLASGLRRQINLANLNLSGCSLGNIDPLIALLPTLTTIEVLNLHGIHDSDVIHLDEEDVERKRTRELAEVIGRLPRLHTLHFDMAYSESNTASGMAYGAYAGGRTGYYVSIPAAIVPAIIVGGIAGAAATPSEYADKEVGEWPSEVQEKVNDATGSGMGAGFEFGRRLGQGIIAIPGSILGTLGGLVTDAVQCVRGRSEPEALAIVQNLSRPPLLREIHLWRVTFDYNRDNFRRILEGAHPGITIRFPS